MRHSILLLLVILPFISFSQTGYINGNVKDEKTGSSIFSATVSYNRGEGGTTTDFDGKFSLNLKPGKYELEISAIGYSTITLTVELKADEVVVYDLLLQDKMEELGIVIISETKYEKRLGEETVSIEVLKPDLIEHTNSVKIEDALNKIPGVNMIGEQANIRGGSGFSDGAASRVMILVDGLPIIQPDNGSANWDALPTQNIQQIEIIKGAASALYGSSAMNGIMNFITAWPKEKPYTKFQFYNGVYLNPERKELIWWKTDRPLYFGGNFLHRQRFGNFDFVAAASLVTDKSYLKNNSQQRMKLNINTRYRPKNFDRLSIGLNINTYYSEGERFFLWKGYHDSTYTVAGVNVTAHIPDDDSLLVTNEVSAYRDIPFNLDPSVTFFDMRGNRHSFKSRASYMNYRALNDTSNTQFYFGEYSFQRFFDSLDLNLVLGASGYSANIISTTFSNDDTVIVKTQVAGVNDTILPLPKHTSANAAFYFQIEKKFFDRLTLNFGSRLEYYRIDETETENIIFDSTEIPFKPVLRFGLNFQIAQGTFFRASYGQGYRFPTIAEKFVDTDRNGIHVYPNPHLQPETGWSAEIGLKQIVQLSDWITYLDVSGFITRYENMMEFTFGQWGTSGNPFKDIGFKSLNIDNTQISGIEFSAFAQGALFGLPTSFLMGYTNIDPVNLNYDPSDSLSVDNYETLKYRYRNSAKADVETTWKKITVGINAIYNSFMEQIDPYVETFVSGIEDFRANHNSGDLVLDLRFGFHLNENTEIFLIGKNVMNREYTLRPGYLEPPRTIAIQFSQEF